MKNESFCISVHAFSIEMFLDYLFCLGFFFCSTPHQLFLIHFALMLPNVQLSNLQSAKEAFAAAVSSCL